MTKQKHFCCHSYFRRLLGIKKEVKKYYPKTKIDVFRLIHGLRNLAAQEEEKTDEFLFQTVPSF